MCSTRRALNRATLERQLLLRRSTMSPSDAVAPSGRAAGAEPARSVPGHVVAARRVRSRCRRRAVDGPIAGAHRGDARHDPPRHRRRCGHVASADAAGARRRDRPSLRVRSAPRRRRSCTGLAVARRVADRPSDDHARSCASALAEQCPDVHAAAAAYACRCLLPLVQVPPRGVWGRSGQVTLAVLDGWVDRPRPVSRAERRSRSTPSCCGTSLRSVRPPSPTSPRGRRLTGLREVIDRLRPQLRVFRDERGRELFDLPDAPRPDADVTAPVRFLPEYDNVLLSHADRSRFASDDDGAVVARRRSVQGRRPGGRRGARPSGTPSTTSRRTRSTVVVEHLPMAESTRRTSRSRGPSSRRFLARVGDRIAPSRCARSTAG